MKYSLDSRFVNYLATRVDYLDYLDYYNYVTFCLSCIIVRHKNYEEETLKAKPERNQCVLNQV